MSNPRTARTARTLRTQFRVDPLPEQHAEECGWKEWAFVLGLAVSGAAAAPESSTIPAVPSALPSAVPSAIPSAVFPNASDAAPFIAAAVQEDGDVNVDVLLSKKQLLYNFLGHAGHQQEQSTGQHIPAEEVLCTLIDAYTRNPSLLVTHAVSFVQQNDRANALSLQKVALPAVKFICYGMICRVVCRATGVVDEQGRLLGLYNANESLAKNVKALMTRVKNIVKQRIQKEDEEEKNAFVIPSTDEFAENVVKTFERRLEEMQKDFDVEGST